MGRQPEDLHPSLPPFLVTLPAIFSCSLVLLPVDEDGGGDEGGDEEDDPRRLLLRRPRVRHVLEPVQRRLLFSERDRKEIERNSGFVGWSVKEIRTVKRPEESQKKAASPTTGVPLLFLGNSHKLATIVE